MVISDTTVDVTTVRYRCVSLTWRRRASSLSRTQEPEAGTLLTAALDGRRRRRHRRELAVVAVAGRADGLVAHIGRDQPRLHAHGGRRGLLPAGHGGLHGPARRRQARGGDHQPRAQREPPSPVPVGGDGPAHGGREHAGRREHRRGGGGGGPGARPADVLAHRRGRRRLHHRHEHGPDPGEGRSGLRDEVELQRHRGGPRRQGRNGGHVDHHRRHAGRDHHRA